MPSTAPVLHRRCPPIGPPQPPSCVAPASAAHVTLLPTYLSPKSMSLMCWSRVIRILSGLRSRCTMPWVCRWSTANTTCECGDGGIGAWEWDAGRRRARVWGPERDKMCLAPQLQHRCHRGGRGRQWAKEGEATMPQTSQTGSVVHGQRIPGLSTRLSGAAPCPVPRLGISVPRDRNPQVGSRPANSDPRQLIGLADSLVERVMRVAGTYTQAVMCAAHCYTRGQ